MKDHYGFFWRNNAVFNFKIHVPGITFRCYKKKHKYRSAHLR